MLTQALLLIKWAVRACLLKVVTVMSSSVHVLRRWLRPGCCRLQQPCQIQFRILDGTRRVNWSNPAASSKPQASSGSKATSGQPCTPSSLLPGPAISIVCSTRWMSMCNSGRQDWTAMAGYGATCPNNSRFQLQVPAPGSASTRPAAPTT